MKCSFPKELLALHVEGDLPGAEAEATESHLRGCGNCRSFLEQLRARQALLKSLRRATINASACAGMRRDVMSAVRDSEKSPGWAVRIERALLVGFRRRAYAFATAGVLGIVAIVSASLLAQMRHAAPKSSADVAVLEGIDTLLRPEGYREWVFVGGSLGPHDSGSHHPAASPATESFNNVYINRTAYREYAKTGKFPEGTVMVLESVRSETSKEPGLQGAYQKDFFALKASVKDSSRFGGGWGFFDFTDSAGNAKAKAQALPEARGCRSCHEERAETDHVFTQFYPVLARAGLSEERRLGAPVSRNQLVVSS